MNFESLNIIEPVLKSLKEEGYEKPTPIQAKAIPVVMNGSDLLGCAQTGTGKTAAFAIPIIQHMVRTATHERRRAIRALILTPTRELAIQIDDSFKAYGRHTGLVSTVIFGGVNQHAQVQALRRGIDILVATPGRLLDLIGQGIISLDTIRYFVLDEADRMLDMGFIHDIRKLLVLLPKKRQSLFFSATLPPEIVKLAGSILDQPVHIAVTPVSSTVEIIRQYVYFVDKKNKINLLIDLLRQEKAQSVLVFTRTKHGADKVVRVLQKKQIKADAIHGNKAQNARQRALGNFRDRTIRVLVATDIAARGIDIDDLELVINYDISNIAETYVHRIGRTGRAGAGGTAISFCDAEEKAYLKDVEKLIARPIEVVDAHDYPMEDFYPVAAPARQHRGQETRIPAKTEAGRVKPNSRGGWQENRGHKFRHNGSLAGDKTAGNQARGY